MDASEGGGILHRPIVEVQDAPYNNYFLGIEINNLVFLGSHLGKS